jgi:hypothetical protein
MEKNIDPELLHLWKAMIAAWLANPKAADPYVEPEASMQPLTLIICQSHAQADNFSRQLRDRLKVAETARNVEAARARQPPPDIMTTGIFVMTGRQLLHRQ